MRISHSFFHSFSKIGVEFVACTYEKSPDYTVDLKELVNYIVIQWSNVNDDDYVNDDIC
jgi:hypothetical protein